MSFDMKYIDAEKLKKIVEQAKQRALKGVEVDENMYCDGRADAFGDVLLEIDSLQQEQQEVDLEEEMRKELRLHYNDDQDVYWWNYLKNSFRHFYELGLNARKEE